MFNSHKLSLKRLDKNVTVLTRLLIGNFMRKYNQNQTKKKFTIVSIDQILTKNSKSQIKSVGINLSSGFGEED